MNNELIKAFTSSKNEEFETPAKFFDVLNQEYNFQIDLAATHKNRKTQLFVKDLFNLDLERVDIFEPYRGSSVYMNPPYGKGIGRFIERAISLTNKYNFTLVMLLPARTDTKWFNLIYDREKNIAKPGFIIKFLQGRLTFEIDGKPCVNPTTGKKSCALFPSMIVEYRTI